MFFVAGVDPLAEVDGKTEELALACLVKYRDLQYVHSANNMKCQEVIDRVRLAGSYKQYILQDYTSSCSGSGPCLRTLTERPWPRNARGSPASSAELPRRPGTPADAPLLAPAGNARRASPTPFSAAAALGGWGTGGGRALSLLVQYPRPPPRLIDHLAGPPRQRRQSTSAPSTTRAAHATARSQLPQLGRRFTRRQSPQTPTRRRAGTGRPSTGRTARRPPGTL